MMSCGEKGRSFGGEDAGDVNRWWRDGRDVAALLRLKGDDQDVKRVE